MRQTKSVRLVEVVSYDNAWGAMFKEEKHKLSRALGDEVVEVHHIGSTAIPQMWAKPTIDILVVVRDIEKVDKHNRSMTAIGYAAMGEYGISGRRFFTKGQSSRTHHVHVFQEGSPQIERHLRFRDFMIAHPSEAARYAELKRELAERFKSDIDSYCEGKDAFIRDIDAKASIWARKKGPHNSDLARPKL
jgi:GrpB-like predicted nucleotidyltransferase (UPF0157 family)